MDTQVEASLPSASKAATNAIASGGAPGGADGWTQIRVAHLIEDTAPSGVGRAAETPAPAPGAAAGVPVGLYCCSPVGRGFDATFRHLTVASGRLRKGGESSDSGSDSD